MTKFDWNHQRTALTPYCHTGLVSSVPTFRNLYDCTKVIGCQTAFSHLARQISFSDVKQHRPFGFMRAGELELPKVPDHQHTHTFWSSCFYDVAFADAHKVEPWIKEKGFKIDFHRILHLHGKVDCCAAGRKYTSAWARKQGSTQMHEHTRTNTLTWSVVFHCPTVKSERPGDNKYFTWKSTT